MNVGATLRWGEMVLWHLDHPDSQARAGIEVQRMEEKLSWLRAYRDPLAQWRRLEGVIHPTMRADGLSFLAQWRRLEGVIHESPSFIDTEGLYRGAADDL
jgi:hypothetical protein